MQDQPLTIGGGDALDQPLPLFFDRVGHGDDRPVGEEPQGDRLSQRAGAAGDDGDAAGEGCHSAEEDMIAERWISS